MKTETACVEFAVDWQSETATHHDRYCFDKIESWRDVIPGQMDDMMQDRSSDALCIERFCAGNILPECSPDNAWNIYEFS